MTISRSQLVAERGDRLVDELRAVVRRDEPDPGRQGRLELLHARLDARDDVAGVLGMAHDDDAADRLARAVEIRDAAAHLGPERHRRDVAQQDRRAALVRLQDHLLEIGFRLHVAAPANHELAAGELEQAAADLAVARPDGLGHLHDAEVEGAEPVRIDRHLVLLDEAADRRDLGDAGHRLQAVAEVPVLERPQVRERLRAGVVDEGVLVDPSDAGRVGPELGPHALGQQRLDLRAGTRARGCAPSRCRCRPRRSRRRS